MDANSLKTAFSSPVMMRCERIPDPKIEITPDLDRSSARQSRR